VQHVYSLFLFFIIKKVEDFRVSCPLPKMGDFYLFGGSQTLNTLPKTHISTIAEAKMGFTEVQAQQKKKQIKERKRGEKKVGKT